MMVVILLIGILAAITLPSWLSFVNTRHLNIAQDEFHRAMHQAQSQAKKHKLTWQASFREQNGIVQWTIHQAEAEKFIPDAVINNDGIWSTVHSSVAIDIERNNKGKYETTLPKQTSPQVWRVIFNYQGCPIYQVGDECTKTSLRTLGQITLYSKNNVKVKRCIYVSTILGATRTGKEHSRNNENDKYCY
ncbi:MAG: type II secretion system protein [Aulosira sp. DedQUE10]|nr:type II secretion system protein [Aulosira sp. DedQUE10]